MTVVRFNFTKASSKQMMMLSTLQLGNMTLFVRCENGLSILALGANSYTPLRIRTEGNGYCSLH